MSDLKRFVIRIALHRRKAGAPDKRLDTFDRGCRTVARLLEDMLFHQNAAEIVGAGQET